MNYAEIARESRLKVLDLLYKAQTSHIGSLLGAADIFAVLFEKIDLDKDKFVLSAGWKAALLYYHLWRKGRITLEELDSYCQEGSKFIGLAEPITDDIPIAGGSMQMGLPGAVGLALSKKLRDEDGLVYCLMSDGEMAGGMIYESALIAAHHKINNLVVILENNSLQAMGDTEDILSIQPIQDKWASWRWEVSVIDGHDYEELHARIAVGVDWVRQHSNMPQIIIAKTVKGKGVSFMEGNNDFHYRPPTKEQYEKAIKELHETET